MSGEDTARYNFLTQFDRAVDTLPGDGWLSTFRRDALTRFQDQGLPSQKDEDWKYTSLRPISQGRFALAKTAPSVSAEQVDNARVPELDAARLVFVNGRYQAELSDTAGLPDGVKLRSIAQAMEDDPEALQARLSRQSGLDYTPFTALNNAFVRDGALLEIAANVQCKTPIELLFISAPGDEAFVFHPRVLIQMNQGSEATVLEHHVGLDGAANFNNVVSEIALSAQSRLDHYLLQRQSSAGYHIGGVHVHQARDSHYVNHNVNLGGALVRHDINARLAEEGSEAILNGLYLVSDRQHVDNHTCVDHAAPHTNSDETYKGVLDGRGRAVFNGRVVVHKHAQKIDAGQKNDNLLLTKLAEVDTKPELEIYADDVACSHGATIGQLDPDALFYLRSRGVDEAKARDLLTYAFAESVIERMALAEVRDWLSALVVNRVSEEGRLADLEAMEE
ncbi:Fe-S cluster assembly protein SufD [Natronospira proteinivora]|uniref:Fe-S cluster assembly protein SufD n=1 Tax=Natronospira proteinivora TaxID=1807133 RepID=A0ABT1G6P1_9GAMM|nr:Fe-S cluster assembly protein SufD [Natronospira proteinivora]MCP1726762.1 Fe-S cluster assembly protein SufD [Natronospira proteinivora]